MYVRNLSKTCCLGHFMKRYLPRCRNTTLVLWALHLLLRGGAACEEAHQHEAEPGADRYLLRTQTLMAQGFDREDVFCVFVLRVCVFVVPKSNARQQGGCHGTSSMCHPVYRVS